MNGWFRGGICVVTAWIVLYSATTFGQMRAHGTEGGNCNQCGSSSTRSGASSRPDPRAKVMDDLNANLRALDQARDLSLKAVQQIGNALREDRRSQDYQDSRDDNRSRDRYRPARSSSGRESAPRYDPPRNYDPAPVRQSGPPQPAQPARSPQQAEPVTPSLPVIKSTQSASAPQRQTEPTARPLPSPEDVQRALAPQMDSVRSDLDGMERNLQVFKAVDPGTTLLTAVNDATSDALPASGSWRSGYRSLVDTIDRTSTGAADTWSGHRQSLESGDSANQPGSAGDWVRTASTLSEWFWNSPVGTEIRELGNRCNSYIASDSETGNPAVDAAAVRFSAAASPCTLFVRTFPGNGLRAIRGIYRYESDKDNQFMSVFDAASPGPN